MNKEMAETLVRTGAGTAMGELMRRYWVPALLSSEIAQADAPQVRVQLMGATTVLAAARRPLEDFRVAEVVEDDDLRAFHDLLHLERDVPEIARPGAGEMADASGCWRGFFHGARWGER